MRALAIRRAFGLVGEGEARPVIAAELSLEKAADAHRLLQGCASIGKVELAVSD